MGTIRIFSISWFLFIFFFFFIKWQRWCKVLCLINCNHEKKNFFPIFLVQRLSWKMYMKLVQKQPSIAVLVKMCSENKRQIDRRTLMLTCDFNKATLQFYRNHISTWVFSCKFAACFQNTFLWEHVWLLLLDSWYTRV